jgi:serine/threonine protein kinase
MESLVGKQLGKYRLIRLLGEGGFAQVYLGEHTYLGTQAALKVLYTRLGQEEIEHFKEEARTIAHLRHPHIVRVLEFDIEDAMPFLVMDYAPGGTLRQLHPRGTRLPLPTVVSYVNQVAQALQYAHDQKLIHRDIKPENMLLDERGQVLLSDFGIAVIAQSTYSQHPQETAGTVTYMAPEQINMRPRPASDQYALAVVVYEWLCGECPFTGSFTEVAAKHLLVPPAPLQEKIPKLSPVVSQVVMTALAKEPKERFASIRAFATALEQSNQPVRFSAPPAYRREMPPAPAWPQGNQSLSGAVPQQVLPPERVLPVHMMDQSSQLNRNTPAEMPLRDLPAEQWQRPPERQRLRVQPLYIAIVIGLVFLLVLFTFVSFSALNAQKQTSATGAGHTRTATSVTRGRKTTPTFTPTPTEGPPAYIPYHGTLVLDDPLHDNSRGYGWQDFPTNGSGGACQFEADGYHVSEQQPYFQSCHPAARFTNVIFEVQMKILSGNCGGIVLRDTTAQAYAYAFLVCQDGSYQLDRFDGFGKTPSTLINDSSSAIKTGLNKTNVLAGVIQGCTIDLYVNGRHLATEQDCTYSAGQIGVAVNIQAQAVFSDAKAWKM